MMLQQDHGFSSKLSSQKNNLPGKYKALDKYQVRLFGSYKPVGMNRDLEEMITAIKKLVANIVILVKSYIIHALPGLHPRCFLKRVQIN